MIIGIDGNEANVEKRLGVGEYSFELLKQFEEHYPATAGSNIKFKIYLKNAPLSHMPKEREGWSYEIIKPGKLWTQIGLPVNLYLHKPRPDIFFTPTHYSPRFSPVSTAISIMDTSYIYYPELFKKRDLYKLKNWTSYSVKRASRIFTISKASKSDIIKIYKIPENKVIVTYPGIKQEVSIKKKVLSMKELKDKYGVEGEYVLFVGTLQPRKNIIRLIEAFSKIRGPVKSFPPASAPAKSPSSNAVRAVGSPPTFVTPNLSLLIVGKRGWMYEEILAAPKKFGVEDEVEFLDFVPDEDLPSLYKNALCFVLPSLYEGFGLPVLEAMQNGCPVITSNVSSLPEAGGDAALYVNPEDVNDIAGKIQKVISSKKLRSDMIEKGYNQVKKFSWEKTARETLGVLEEVVKV